MNRPKANNAAIASGDPASPNQPSKTVGLGTSLLMRNFEMIVSRFEEHDPIFDAVSRLKLESLNKSMKDNPAPGTYNPKLNTFKSHRRTESKKGGSFSIDNRVQSPLISTQDKGRRGFLDITVTTLGHRGSTNDAGPSPFSRKGEQSVTH